MDINSESSLVVQYDFDVLLDEYVISNLKARNNLFSFLNKTIARNKRINAVTQNGVKLPPL